MKRQFDDSPLDANQSRDPAGDEEDLLRQTWVLDLLASAFADPAFPRQVHHGVERRHESGETRREAPDLSGSARCQVGNDAPTSDQPVGHTSRRLSLGISTYRPRLKR